MMTVHSTTCRDCGVVYSETGKPDPDTANGLMGTTCRYCGSDKAEATVTDTSPLHDEAVIKQVLHGHVDAAVATTMPHPTSHPVAWILALWEAPGRAEPPPDLRRLWIRVHRGPGQ